MEMLLTALRAAAEPTRLRLLALAASGSFCVMEFAAILGQSQPRLSRHLKLLCEARLLERVPEGGNVWFVVPPTEEGKLARELIARLPPEESILVADRREAARVLAERARVASDSFRRQGADWDEMRALGLPAAAVAEALRALLPEPRLGRLIDIGTGTGGVLEAFADRLTLALGIDASRAMLALARTRLAKPGLEHCTVRQGDMYRLPAADGSFDVAVLQMVLHYAQDPAAALIEAARTLRPGGQLVVVDLAPHGRTELRELLAHRWLGFGDADMETLLRQAGLQPGPPVAVSGALAIRLWPARRAAAGAARTELVA